MALLTTYANFKGLLYVPGVESDGPERTILNDMIAIYEPELFRGVMGVTMYDTFEDNTTATTGVWGDLLNGKTYTDSATGRVNRWLGLGLANPAACYVYYWIRRNRDMSTTMQGGEYISRSENMQVVSPGQKMVTAWNRMVGYLEDMDAFLKAHASSYPDYDGHTWPVSDTIYLQRINTFGI